MTHPATPSILQAARNRIADQEHWTRKTYARDAKGAEIHYLDPLAVSWCSIGTLYRECGGGNDLAIGMRDYLNTISVEFFRIPMLFLNDTLRQRHRQL